MNEESILKEGSAAFVKGNYLQAVKCYSQAIELNSKNPKSFSNRSAAYASLQQYDDALKDAQSCIEVDRSFVKGYGRLGTALQGLKRYEEARNAFQLGLKIDPTNANYNASIQELNTLIASGAGIAGDEQKRLYYLEQSLKKGTDAMKRNEPGEAVRHFTKALSHCNATDKHTLLANRSAAHFNAGDYRESIEDADASAAASPKYSRAYLRKALALNKLNRLMEASQAVQKALELTPTCEKSLALKKEIDENLNAAAPKQEATTTDTKPAAAPAQPRVVLTNRSSSYSYCNYCNRHGHTRANCPLRAKK